MLCRAVVVFRDPPTSLELSPASRMSGPRGLRLLVEEFQKHENGCPPSPIDISVPSYDMAESHNLSLGASSIQ